MSDNHAGTRPRWQARARRTLAPVVDGYRMYRGTASLLALTASFALGAVLPVAGLLSTGAAASLTRLGLETGRNSDLGLAWKAVPEAAGATEQRAVDFFFQLLLASAVATLAISVLSLFTLFIARALAREGEVSVRRAVGASRRSLLASAIVEGLGIGAVAVVTGGALGLMLGQRMGGSWPGVMRSGSILPLLLTVALVAGILLAGSLFPVLFARRDRIAEAEMKPLSLFAPALLQLGLSLITLTAGALLVRRAADPTVGALAGAPGDRLFQVDTGMPGPALRAAAYTTLLADLAHHPELGTVSLTSPGALVGLGPIAQVTTDCGACSEGGLPIRWRTIPAVHQFVSADSFRAIGLHLLEGRGFTDRDRLGSARVAIVNRALAQHHFQFGEAIGRQLQVGVDKDEWYTVVGVVDNAAAIGFGATLQPPFTVYLSVLQHPTTPVELLVQGGAVPATPIVTRALHALSASGTVTPRTGADLVSAEAAPLRWFGRWLGFEGWTMFGVGALGIFALLRIWVVSFYPEYGMRRAVGARRRDVMVLILRQALGVGLGGIAFGLWFGPSVWTTLAEVVPGLPAWDAALFARFGAVLIGAALTGALLPARAAARRSPHTLIGAAGE